MKKKLTLIKYCALSLSMMLGVTFTWELPVNAAPVKTVNASQKGASSANKTAITQYKKKIKK